MDEILNRIFEFLSANRQYNRDFQKRFYLSVISPYENTSEKVLSLLYSIASTQSRANFDCLSNFYRGIYSNLDELQSFERFMKILVPNGQVNPNYDGLFRAMKSQRGWGEKTAALFTHVIYHLHNGQYGEELSVWPDVPQAIEQNDFFYLPVDAVIKTVFNELDDTINWDFKKINKKLHQSYSGQEIEVWEDLWFWGTFNQSGTGENRKLGWNIDKYWMSRFSDKNQNQIIQIENLSTEFRNLLT